jgi:hypothetical protein
MNRHLAVILLLTGCVHTFAIAQEPSPTNPSRPDTRKLLIAPSSTWLGGGTARLAVGALNREPGTYTGDYRIKVFPYFFKNETGCLSVQVSNLALHKLTQGVAVRLVGHATTNGTGQTRSITAWARPSANDSGALTFAVATIDGNLIFNTSYRLER